MTTVPEGMFYTVLDDGSDRFGVHSPGVLSGLMVFLPGPVNPRLKGLRFVPLHSRPRTQSHYVTQYLPSLQPPLCMEGRDAMYLINQFLYRELPVHSTFMSHPRLRRIQRHRTGNGDPKVDSRSRLILWFESTPGGSTPRAPSPLLRLRNDTENL